MKTHTFTKTRMRKIAAILICLGATMSCSHPPAAKPSTSWNPKAAAAYLDYREAWWSGWNGSARDHGTFCVSCHTALPYALARPALRTALAEPSPTVNEEKLLEDVTRRVRLWKTDG